jgi:choline monooxygenase
MTAAHLQARSYTDPAVLEAERKGVFGGGWISVCLASTLEPGAARPVEVAGWPLLMTRSRSGTLHVFHNVCRHRGMRLLEKACDSVRRLTCPYHAWSYDLSGALRAAPWWDGAGGSAPPGEVAESLALVAVRHAVWFDVVFVDLSGEALAFDRWIAPLAARWRDFDASRLQRISVTPYEIPANWKLVCENFLDGYHVPFVHRQVGGPQIASDFEDLVLSEDLFGFFMPKGEADKPKPEWLPRPALSPNLQQAQHFIYLFPNTLLALAAGWFQVISVQPTAVDQTSEFLGLYATEPLPPKVLDDAQHFSAEMNRVNEQDVEILARLQAGRASPAADLGNLAPYWDGCGRAFHARVRRALDGPSQGR